MDKKRYLFVSYTICTSCGTVNGDKCFEFHERNKVTIKDIRKSIISDAEELGFNTKLADPTIVCMQVLDEDIARMLYEF